MNFYKVVLIIICKHLEIYTKTISRLRLSDYKPIFTSPRLSQYRFVIGSASATNCKIIISTDKDIVSGACFSQNDRHIFALRVDQLINCKPPIYRLRSLCFLMLHNVHLKYVYCHILTHLPKVLLNNVLLFPLDDQKGMVWCRLLNTAPY